MLHTQIISSKNDNFTQINSLGKHYEGKILFKTLIQLRLAINRTEIQRNGTPFLNESIQFASLLNCSDTFAVVYVFESQFPFT